MATHRLRYNDRELTVSVTKSDNGYSVAVDGQDVELTRKGDEFVVSSGSDVCTGQAVANKSRVFVSLSNRLFEFDIVGADSVSSSGDSAHSAEKDKLRAPMPGKIVKILIEEGQSVTEKQPLAVIESMKMENQLLSPGAGTVKKVCFTSGEQVDTDDVLVELDVE